MSSENDIDVLARTIYGEARGEYGRPDGGIASLICVGNVVMNRLAKMSWFGRSVREVCQKPWQFSCWNYGDVNRHIIEQVDAGDGVFKVCKDVAYQVAHALWPDLTGGCDHYYSALLKSPPKWAVGKPPKFRIGRHLFFNLGDV